MAGESIVLCPENATDSWHGVAESSRSRSRRERNTPDAFIMGSGWEEIENPHGHDIKYRETRRLGDLIYGTFADIEIDSAEEVRRLREGI